MKTENKVIILSAGLGLSFWMIDTLLRYLFTYEEPFVALLISNIPTPDVYIRPVGVASILAIGIVISRILAQRKRAEEEEARLRQRLEAQWGVARMIDADHQTLCDLVLAEIVAFTQSRYALYGFLNKDETVIALYAWSEQALQECQVRDKATEYPITEAGLWGDAVRQRRMLIVNDYQADHPGKRGLPEGHVPLTRILAMPIFSHGRIVALAAVANKPSDYTEDDARQIEAFVTGVQLVLERRQSEEALRQSERRVRRLAAASVRAHEEEQQWLAYELHDRVSQTLVSVFQHLQVLRSLTRGKSQARGVVERASGLAQEAIRETRNIMDGLYPPALDEFGVVALMEEELRHLQEDTGCRTSLEADCPVRLPRDVQVTLYRIFHEALTNMRRHAAGATNVTVSFAGGDSTVSLQFKDDGPGFDVEAAVKGKRVGGLTSMRRRAELIGGTFEVTSVPGQGTTVTIQVPVSAGVGEEGEGR